MNRLHTMLAIPGSSLLLLLLSFLESLNVHLVDGVFMTKAPSTVGIGPMAKATSAFSCRLVGCGFFIPFIVPFALLPLEIAWPI